MEGEVARVQECEHRGADRVCEDLDVGAGAFAAGEARCGEGQVGLLGVVDL